MLEAYLSIDGRIRRWRFFLYSLVLGIIIPVLTLLAIPAVHNARDPFIAGIIAFVGISIFWAWAGSRWP